MPMKLLGMDLNLSVNDNVMEFLYLCLYFIQMWVKPRKQFVVVVLLFLFSYRLEAQDQDPLCEKLLEASFNGNIFTVEGILKKNVKPDCISEDGLTPLFYAVDRGDERMARLLLKYGANINQNALTEKGETPLILAVESGKTSVVELLLNNKANPGIPNNNGSVSLHFAAYNNDTTIIGLLLRNGAKVDNADNYGVTPLMRASWNGSMGAIEMLIAAKADVNIADKSGFTPLMYASQNGQYDAAVVLMKNWANIHAVSSRNASALSLSITNGHPDMVDLFLLNGANPNENYTLSLNPLSLSRLYGTPAIRDTIRKWGGKNNLLPCFAYNGGVGLNLRFNNKDFQIGAKILFKDIKYNLETSVYFSMRLFAIPVLVSAGNNSYYQFWERMHTFGISFGKLFLLTRPGDKEYGIFTEALCEYSFGRYRGTDISINSGIRLKPSMGFEKRFAKINMRISTYYSGSTTFGNPNWGIDITLMRTFTSCPAKIKNCEL
jgi:ankyrin repeat protein